ncbi:MAG: GAF domain-containing protein [Ardenticatenales bacterium]|nr:GAF domain-containing protein [Ardenticatenales bacterium]
MSKATAADIDRLFLSVHARLGQCATLDAQLDELMALITEAVDADRATLFLNDAATGELYARVAVGVRTREIRLLNTDGVAGHVFHSAHGVIAPDARADPHFDPRIDEITGYQTNSLLCVPMRTVDGTVIGVAQALNKRSGTFDATDLAVLDGITMHAALVLRSALLARDAAHAGEEQARFVRLVSELSSELQLGPLLQRIMAAVTQMLDAERSTLFLNDEKTGELFTEIGQGLGLDRMGAEKIRFPNDRGIAGAVFTSRQSVNIPHAYADLRFNPAFDQRTGFFTRSILCAPVTNKAGTVIGVTQVLNKRGGAFTDEDDARLRAFTAQIAIGLENAKLFDDVQAMKRYNERILASMSSGMITFDADGRVVTCNPAAERILAARAADIAGQPVATLFTDANAWVIDKLEHAQADGEAKTTVDGTLVVADLPVAVNVTAMPLTDAHGEPLGSMLLLDDISREKRIKATMARYVDTAVADRLMEDDAALLGGQSGQATILFSDVRDFTPLSEHLGPQATVALLNRYLTRMVGCIEAEGGLLDKFIGDAIVAVFGVPFAHDDDADRAVRAAAAMRRALRELNTELADEDMPALDVGIGIHTGHVFSGNIGSPRRMDFTVMGDGVNLASRVESASKQYRAPVLLTESTRTALRGTYRMRELDRARFVGKTEPVTIHELLEHHDDDTFPALIDALAAFRDGLSLYRARRWPDAIAAFERTLACHPADGVASLFIDRCRTLAASSPDTSWDGVWTLTSK